MDFKSQLAQHYLRGKGLELGALSNPVKVNAELSQMLYADRLPKAEAITLFPELKDIQESLIDADLLLDFDQDNLSEIAQHEFDFVIANHVIEHLVNPIQFLKNISDNLKQGAHFFLTVPDKDHSFDRNRQLTSNAHLWKEYRQGVRSLSNAHIKEFLLNKEPVATIHPEVEKYFIKNGLPLSYYEGNKLPFNPIKRNRLYEFHRQRSIHVHVWNRDSFANFFNEANDKLSLGFERVNTHKDEDVVGEMVYLLKKV